MQCNVMWFIVMEEGRRAGEVFLKPISSPALTEKKVTKDFQTELLHGFAFCTCILKERYHFGHSFMHKTDFEIRFSIARPVLLGKSGSCTCRVKLATACYELQRERDGPSFHVIKASTEYIPIFSCASVKLLRAVKRRVTNSVPSD